MAKQILYRSEARTAIKAGIDAVADAVKVTLGPKGQTVVIDDGYDAPKITKDGVTVAKAIELSDKLNNAGAKLVKKVASKTADDAGDGTTTATVLAQAIVAEGSKLIAEGVNPMSLKIGIDCAAKDAIEFIKSNSEPVKDLATLKSIATVSANGDESVGAMIAEVIDQVGADGVVNVEASSNIETYIEKVNGLKFDRGYIANYFITNSEKGEAVLEKPVILVTDQKISTIKQIQGTLEHVARTNRELLIIAEDVTGEALTMLIINKMRGTLKVAAVKAPAFGDRRKAELEDIAIITGGVVVSPDKGLTLDKVTPDVLGSAEKVVIDAKTTTIVNGDTNKDQFDFQVDNLRTMIENETSNYNKDQYKERLAKLVNGVAVLYVGAASEVELGEKKDRVDDALCATRAANEEGIQPGGGIAYLKAYLHLTRLENQVAEEYRRGYTIMRKALLAPTTQIADNALGEGEGKLIVSHLLMEDSGDYDWGYNARTDTMENLKDRGIIDPTKVCRTAIENASSIAGMFLTTGCVVVDEPEKKDEPTKMM